MCVTILFKFHAHDCVREKKSESGDTIATLNIDANTLVKHVKEQIETTTGIHKDTQCLLHRFNNGIATTLWELRGNGKVSTYNIKHGSTLVLRIMRPKASITSEHDSTPVLSCRSTRLRRKTCNKCQTRQQLHAKQRWLEDMVVRLRERVEKTEARLSEFTGPSEAGAQCKSVKLERMQ